MNILKKYIKIYINESTSKIVDKRKVVAAVIIKDRKVLILQRGETAPWMPCKWNLPGGMVDAGETNDEAVVREIEEETNIVISKKDVVSMGYFDGGSYMLETFKAYTNSNKLPDGSFDSNLRKSLLPISEELGFSESMDYAWITKEEIDNYSFVPTVEDTLGKVFNNM